MRILLDTHVWLWALQRPKKLNRRARQQLDRSTNELYLSPISIWEASILARERRFTFGNSFDEWLEEAMTEAPFQEVPITAEVAKRATQIQLKQPDPGDLFITATADYYDLTLLTNDSQLLELSWLKTIEAR